MNTEEMGESLKKVEEALHEIHVAENREQWLSWLSLSTAIIAVFAAIVGLFETQATSRTLLEKNDAILLQSRASDQWSYYQAKSIKGHIYEVNAGLFPAKQEEFQKMTGKYDQEKKEIKEKAESLEKQSEERSAASEKYFEQHHVFAVAETFLGISIAVASIAALTRKKMAWYFSLGLSGCGVAAFVFGYFAR